MYVREVSTYHSRKEDLAPDVTAAAGSRRVFDRPRDLSQCAVAQRSEVDQRAEVSRLRAGGVIASRVVCIFFGQVTYARGSSP